jgi:hypothetical protein
MESYLGLLGTLLFMLLILAAAVEAIIEVFRGILEFSGRTWLKGGTSLDDALKMADEFAPKGSELEARLEALKSVTAQLKGRATVYVEQIDRLKEQLPVRTNADTRPDSLSQVTFEMNKVASSVNQELESRDRKRIFVLRVMAAVVGCVLVGVSGLYPLQILLLSPDMHQFLAGAAQSSDHALVSSLQDDWVNIILGGLAAAAGSSFWHDKLDKVRNLKGVVGELGKVR